MNERIAAFEDASELIYLDNAATTWPKPQQVYDFAYDYYRRYGGNAGRGNNPLARTCAKLLDDTRSKLASWLGAPSPEQIVFTSSVTEALNIAILGYSFRPGDVVYVTPFEHNSVLRPIEHLRKTRGIEVRQIPFNRKTYVCELNKLNAAFHVEPPTMVCVTQASNVCGLMPPVEKIAKLAKDANPDSVVIIDAAQTAGIHSVSLSEGLIDILSFSGHKSLYAFYGIAGLVFGTEWRPEPLMFGGTGTISESVSMPKTLPSAYEAGSQNILAIAGLYAAINWLDDTGRKIINDRTTQAANYIVDFLQSDSRFKTYIPQQSENWSGIISFSLEEMTPQNLETILGSKNIAVRAGLHCAPWAHNWFQTSNTGGTVRISPSHFNTREEVELFCSNLSSLLI